MQKILALLLIMAVISLTACADSAAPTVAGFDEPAIVDEEPDEAAPAATEQLVTGTVVYYDGATLAICTPDHMNLNFLVAGGEVDTSETRGLLAGSAVDVHYTGTISGGNTSAAQVTKLAQTAEQAAVEDGMGVIGGIVTGADADQLHILTFGGEALTFAIASGDIDRTHSRDLQIDAYVTVFYKGVIANGGTSAVRVLKIV